MARVEFFRPPHSPVRTSEDFDREQSALMAVLAQPPGDKGIDKESVRRSGSPLGPAPRFQDFAQFGDSQRFERWRDSWIKKNRHEWDARVKGGITQPFSFMTLVANGPTVVNPSCEVSLTASCGAYGQYYDWWVLGNGQQLHLGTSSVSAIQFSVGAAVFGTGSYSAICSVYVWDNTLNGGNGGWFVTTFHSNTVAVQFTGPPAGTLNSVTLNVPSVKGGNNGTDPLLTVYLTAPAAPCGVGQRVYLATSNPNLMWLASSNPGYFTIPAGQSSGAISWFLATKKVYVTGRHADILVFVSNPGSSTGYDQGNATLYLTK